MFCQDNRRDILERLYLLEIESYEDSSSVLLYWSLRDKFTFSNLAFYNVCLIVSFRNRLYKVEGEFH